MGSSTSVIRIAACIAAVLAMAGARPAHADLSDLEWQYKCLKDPDAVCYDATPSGTDPPTAGAGEPASPAVQAPRPGRAIAARRPARELSAAEPAVLPTR